MAVEALAWPAEPTLTDGDDAENYNLGTRFTVLVDTLCVGVRWRVPDTLQVPTSGTHVAGLWNASTETRLLAVDIDPTPGGYEDYLFDTPYLLLAGVEYQASILTRHYTFRSSATPYSVLSPSGNVEGTRSQLSTTSDPNTFPAGTFTAWYYISPLTEVGGDPEPGPDGLAVPVALGTPAVGVVAVDPAGLAVPIALGVPGVGLVAVARPAGVAIPVSLGVPDVLDLITPPGVAIPLGLGGPGVGLVAAPSPDGLAVPVGLGTPGVAALIGPDGLPIPVVLGVPAVEVAAVPRPNGVAVPLVLGTPELEAAAAQPDSVVVPVVLGTPAAGPTVPVLHLPVLSGTATVSPGPTGAATVPGLSGTAILI